MKRIILAFAVAILLPLSAMAQEAAAPLSMKEATNEQTVLFLGGAAQGIGYTNAQLVIEHKEPLFCSPADFQLGAKSLYEAAAGRLQGPQDPGTIVIAALDTFKKKYPCK
jgi:hypothetical protein